MSDDEDELLTVTLNQNRSRLTPNRMMRMPPVPSEAEKDNKEYLTLRVVRPSQEQDNVEIHFRVKRTTQMGKLKRSYSDRVGVEVSSLRFLYDGRRISDDATPGFLEMESGDYIEVYRELGVNLSAQEPLEVNMTGESRERNYDEVSGSSESVRRLSRVNDECEPSQSKKLKFSLDSIQSPVAKADNSDPDDNFRNTRDDELNEVKAQLAEVTKKYEDFVKKLRDKVECPVCFEVPKCAPVPVCPNGHVVCVRCVRDTCPTCRVRMGAATSTLAVTVIENILHTCEHDTCGAVMPLRAMLRHASSCQHRPVTCPGLDCSTRVSFIGLVSHLVSCCVERSEIREYKLPHKFSFMMNEDLKNLTGESQNFNWKLEGVKYDNKVFLLKVSNLTYNN